MKKSPPPTRGEVRPDFVVQRGFGTQGVHQWIAAWRDFTLKKHLPSIQIYIDSHLDRCFSKSIYIYTHLIICFDTRDTRFLPDVPAETWNISTSLFCWKLSEVPFLGVTRSLRQNHGDKSAGKTSWYEKYIYNIYRYQKLTCLKGVTFSKPSLWVSMLVFRWCTMN